ncbi:MAG TPA: hypothetical protein VFN70_18105 [Burkholderiales bacterium]|nr:hypothetical protein [Burkholderiales bacterium]
MSLPPIRIRRLYASNRRDFTLVAEPLPAHVHSCLSDAELMARREEERAAIDAEWIRIREQPS